jgi:hypothetical protein
MGNDIAYMRAGGNIESLIATVEFGDVTADDLSRWISTTVSTLTETMIVYDQAHQKVFFFCNGKVLVLFKDLMQSGKSPWGIYDTQHANGFVTSAAKYMRRPGTSEFSVFFGGSAGQIYDLNGQGAGDGTGTNIAIVRKTGYIDSEAAKINFRAHQIRGAVRYKRIGGVELDITLDWGEEYNETTSAIALKGVPPGDTGVYFGGLVYFGQSVYFNEGFEFSGKVTSQGFSPVGKGPGFFLTAGINTAAQFQIDYIEIA